MGERVTTYRYKCPACGVLGPPTHEQTFRCGSCGAYEADSVTLLARVKELEAALREIADEANWDYDGSDGHRVEGRGFDAVEIARAALTGDVK